MDNLPALQARIAATRQQRGFVTAPLKIGLLLMEEVGEIAAELKPLWSVNYDAFAPERLADELADVFVLLSALASAFDIDLQTAVEDKFFTRDARRNWRSAGRPPEGFKGDDKD